MLEANIEEYLRVRVDEHGGRAEKTIDLTRVGAPDREVQWPWIGIDKVELKKPGEKPAPHQIRYHEYLASCGVPVYLIDTKAKVDLYIAARIARKHETTLWSVTLPDFFFRDPTDPHE